jgi:eukaryotic-like serine/threonine-protein kinase
VPSKPTGAVATFVPAQERPKILFVDDEMRILSALTAVFRLKYDVLVSTEGEQALQMVKEHRPHVIVSDQRMPVMLGIDFLRQARRIDPTSIRILLTGYSDLTAIIGSINDGEVFRFINKPWNNQEIRETIAQAVDIALAIRQDNAGAVPRMDGPKEAVGTGAVVVAQDTMELCPLIESMIGRPVIRAANVTTLLKVLKDTNVAVIACDLDAFHGADEMLKLLKRSHPKIQTVAISSTSDSDNLISLINQAQILRFLNRPLRPGLLARALRSALVVHERYDARPSLVQRQKVQAAPDAKETSIGRQILDWLGV